ncbi:MAG: DUF2007-related protein [Bacteroides sp.]
MKEEDNTKLVEVFVGSIWETELIKGLLESNDIQAILKDGLMTTIAPYISPTATILVNENDYEAAMEIIRSREQNND